MRFYSFTNLYTAGIHAGIQTAHAVHEMQRKYADIAKWTDEGKEKLYTYDYWAQHHQTIIVKQAGYSSSLDELYGELNDLGKVLMLPSVRWKESKQALNGATTAVGIIVPASVYKGLFDTDEGAEAELYRIINRYQMAI